MSYILDALRKADAERERDPARGIHAQPMAAQPPAPRASSQVAWIGAGLLAAALVGYAWSQRSLEAPPVPPHAPVASIPNPMPAVAPPAVVTVSTSVQPAAPPPLAEPVKTALAAPAVIKAPPAPKAAASAAGAPLDHIYAQTELPQDVQAALPKLAISGGVYSENVAQRMLIVGGQVVNEGAELAPGLVLEQIKARNVVLRFRGYKYSVVY